jgi:hypothetical protein
MNPTMIGSKADETRVEVTWTPPTRARIPGGIAVAALMGAMLGMLTLAVVNVLTAASPDFNKWVHDVGKLWMPGAQGIGPYSGKETLALISWLGSWLVLHLTLRKRDVEISRWFIIFLVGVGVATTLIWPPVFEYLAGHK